MWTTSVAAFSAAYQPVPVISHARRASAPQMLATNLPIADELMMWAPCSASPTTRHWLAARQ